MSTDTEAAPVSTPPVVPAQRGSRRGPRRTGAERSSPLWTWLALPGTVWMTLFFIGSLIIVILLAFGTTDVAGKPHFGTSLSSVRHLTDPAYLKVGLRSLVYALITAVLCLLIA